MLGLNISFTARSSVEIRIIVSFIVRIRVDVTVTVV